MNNHKKKKFNPIIAAILLISAIILGVIIINNIPTENIIDESIINKSKNISDKIINEFENIVKDIVQENKTESSKRDPNVCTFKTIKEKVPYFKYIENKTKVVEIIKVNHTYLFEIEDESIRTVTKTMDEKEFNAMTFYDKKKFQIFYNTLEIEGWYSDSKIVNFKSNTEKEEFLITNTDNKDGTYIIYRVYPTEKDYRYFDGKENIIKLEIKKGETEEISFENSEICYKLEYPKEMTNVEKIKQFLKENKAYGITQDDFIIFEKFANDFACVRPYFIVTSEIYQTETKKETEVIDSYYVETEKFVDKIICN